MHRHLLLILVPLTALLLWGLCREGWGPFDSEITFHTTRNLGRGNLDYKLPESHDGPHVHLYHSGCRWNGYVGYYFFDEPYWPGARPAHVPLTQLAPLVTRHVIYAVTPAIPVVMVVLAWTFWGCLFAYAVSTNPCRARGFRVMLQRPD